MTASSRGIVDLPSPRTVDETVTRLRGILEARGITLFALVDHSGQSGRVAPVAPGESLRRRRTA